MNPFPLQAIASRPAATPVAAMPVVLFRGLQTSAQAKDIDSAAKFIGAGAATVGAAGSGAGKFSIIFPPNPIFNTNLAIMVRIAQLGTVSARIRSE